MMTLKYFKYGLITFLLIFLLSSCVSLAEDITPPPGLVEQSILQETPQVTPVASSVSLETLEDSPDANRGAAIYSEFCTPCHGVGGLGDGPDSALIDNQVPAIGSSELARQADPLDWYSLVTGGNMEKFMPPFTNLTDQERWDVVAYLYALSTPEEIMDLGEVLYTENCAECHGAGGQQGEVDLTDLGFMSILSSEEIFTIISNGSDLMPAFDNLSEDNRWILTDYIRLLSFTPLDENLVTGSTEIKTESPETEANGVENEQGVVKVSMVSSSDSPLPSNFEITLRGYEDMVEVYSDTLPMQGEIEILFEDVPLELGRMYFATTEHDNAVYGSGVSTVDSSTSGIDLEIQYFPPSSDLSLLEVDRLHVFVDFVDDQTVEIYQLYIFSNHSNQVIIPEVEDGVTIDFIVPEGSNDLYVEENMNVAYQKTETGFGISNIYPSENPYQTIYSYSVPYEGKKMDLSIPISLDAQALILMTPAGGFKVSGNQLQDVGTQEFEGVTYNMFTSSNLRTGDSIDLTLSGSSLTRNFLITSGEGSHLNLVIGLAVLGLALVTLGIYLLRRNHADEDDDNDDRLEVDSPEEIMDSIIALDDQYKTGGLPEGAYKQRRSELKELLKELYQDKE